MGRPGGGWSGGGRLECFTVMTRMPPTVEDKIALPPGLSEVPVWRGKAALRTVSGRTDPSQKKLPAERAVHPSLLYQGVWT